MTQECAFPIRLSHAEGVKNGKVYLAMDVDSEPIESTMKFLFLDIITKVRAIYRDF